MGPIRPYAQQHVTLNGPGDQRPTAEQVIRDQNLVGALHGINILVTGCTSGIGVETARALYLTGATIYVTARDMTKGEAIAADISADPSRPVKVIEMSLDSFDSVRKGAEIYLSMTSKLNVLVNNAGVMACPNGTTADGHEQQFGTNHLGHFLLFQLLKPALLAGATAERPSRVISVSSTGHRRAGALDFEDLDFSKTEYSPFIAYGRSKLANIYFANELTRRFTDQNLHALSLHPGSISTTLQRHVTGMEIYKEIRKDPIYLAQAKNIAQGAATTVWAAVGKEWMHQGGLYLEDVGEAEPADPDGPLYGTGYSVEAYSPEDEKRLWDLSEHLCRV